MIGSKFGIFIENKIEIRVFCLAEIEEIVM